MKRKEKLSIYLVRPKYRSDHSQAIKIDYAKSPVVVELADADAVLYVKNDPLKPPPSWTRLFTEQQDFPHDLFGERRSVGAVLSVRLGDHRFLFSFGTGFHLIQNHCVEKDFGLIVTLNSVDPEGLRSLDKASYDHTPLNFRTQSSKNVDVYELDVDSELDMLYAITGVSTVPEFGSHLTGREGLTLLSRTLTKGSIMAREERHGKTKRIFGGVQT